MYKKRLIIAVVMAVCFMTACTRKTDSEGGVVGGAAEDNGYQESRTNENEAGRLSDTTGWGTVVLMCPTGAKEN